MQVYYERETTELTASELSHVWSAYMENSMNAAMFQYFQEATEDKDIKKIVGDISNNSQKNLQNLKKYFENENIEVPHGFNSDDIKVSVPKLYSDVFILNFCDEVIKFKNYVYPSAINDSARKDVRKFFSENIAVNLSIQDDLVDIMLSKGVYVRPPKVTVQKQADYIEKKSYLKGLIGNSRPINVAETTCVNRLLQRASFSKMMLLSYAQTASDEDVSKYFTKGKAVAQSIIEKSRSILEEEDLTTPGNWDLNYSESTVGPFSDRLMLFYLLTCVGITCFNSVAQGITASLRTDISAKFIGVESTLLQFYSEGLRLMMEKGYLEKPLEIIDRDKIRKA